MPTENRIYLDPEKRLGLNLYAKLFGSVTVPHSTGTINGTSLGNGYYEFAGLDTDLTYTIYEEAVPGTKAATDDWLAVLPPDVHGLVTTIKAKTDLIGTQSEITVTTPVIPTKWRVFAFNRITNEPVLGDAANITAKLAIDHAGPVALTDVNPVEIEDGYYYFDLSTAEQTGAVFELFPESATSGVQVIGVPGRMESNATLRAIEGKTSLIGIGRVTTTESSVHKSNVTSHWRDSGPITIATYVDLTAVTIEVVVSEFRNLKLIPIATIVNASITKEPSYISLPIPAAVSKEPNRILEYAIRELSNNNTLQKGSWSVRPASDNFL